MSHEIESLAYAGATPWHGLGARVSDDLSIEEMLVAAKLDWNVNMEPMFTVYKGNAVEVPNRRALVRDRDGKVLTIASNNWTPLQNRDAMEFFREFVATGGAKLETAGSLRGGRTIWGMAKINRDFVVKGSANDAVKGYLLMSWSHEVGAAHESRVTTERVVCANTLAIARRDEASYRQTHAKAFDMAAAKASIELAVDQVARMEREANELASLELSRFDAARFYARLLQPMDADAEITEAEYVQELLENPASRNRTFRGVWNSFENGPGATPDNAWGVLNGITHWADHKAISRSNESRLDSAWFGDRAKLKQSAYDQLLEMV